MLNQGWLMAYWSPGQVQASMAIVLNIVGALVLGMVVGYERSYHGRAAGMRTYGMVCMASAALTVLGGLPSNWYGGLHGSTVPGGDPTRIVQGIVTGVGFLGAGAILKDGLNIYGLTTAASIWAASVIGILVGVGFYGAAILLTALSAALMVWGGWLEHLLPARHAISISLRFAPGHAPSDATVGDWLGRCGYELCPESVAIDHDAGQQEWRFVAIAADKRACGHLSRISNLAIELDGVESVHLSHARD